MFFTFYSMCLIFLNLPYYILIVLCSLFLLLYLVKDIFMPHHMLANSEIFGRVNLMFVSCLWYLESLCVF